MNIPSGNVTFLFTDIEGSTKLSQKFPHLLQSALEKHHSILQKTIEYHNGFVFEIIGDAFCAAFERPADAIKAAYEIQIKLSEEEWNEVPIKVRMGINTGDAEWTGKRYMGYITLAKTQRIISVAYGGQILISEDTIRHVNKSEIEEISFRDLGERRLKDIIKPFHIYQLLSEKIITDFPPIKTLDPRQNNLPVQLTSFIGRTEELNQIKKLLKQTHLITLKGAGGSGKTRLAIKVAGDVIDEYKDGVWFIDLTSIRDEALLSQVLSSVLNIKEDIKTDTDQIIINYLKDKEALMVLDNCEHLISACAGMSEKLLLSCPKLRIMTTSREALNCRGEIVFNLHSMKIPNPGKKISAMKLTQYESVNLFIERALAVNPEFTVNNENAASLAEICYRLDGIPLAIELAAARMKVLSLEKIYERLDDRFKLLTGGIRTAFPRQQTLKAMVDWSYDLLSDDEKILLNRLSVFAGGWTLEAAEKVCSDEKINESSILDLLVNLVDKSLVIYIKENERYRMLETIRQYGEEKLVESEEMEKIILNHLKFFLSFAEFANDKLSIVAQKELISKLESDNYNFQLALTSSIVRDFREDGIRLALSLCRYWEIRGHISVARQWLREFFIEKDKMPLMTRANVLKWLGIFDWISGDFNKSRTYFEEGYQIYERLDYKYGKATILNNLASIANLTGKFEESKKLREESYNLFVEIGDEKHIADAQMNLGSTLTNLKEYDKAQEIFENCLRKYQEMGDKRSIAMTLDNLGLLLGLKGEFEQARICLEESLSILRDIGDMRIIAGALNNLGEIISYLGYNKKAVEYMEESIGIYRSMGDKSGLAETLTNLGFVKNILKEFKESISLHKESLELQTEVEDKSGIAQSLTGISENIMKDNPETSVLLICKVEGLLQSVKDTFRAEIQKKYEIIVSFLKGKLGNEKFSETYEKGKAMTLEHITKLALNQ